MCVRACEAVCGRKAEISLGEVSWRLRVGVRFQSKVRTDDPQNPPPISLSAVGWSYRYNMAVEADELGRREEALAHQRAETRTIPSYERARRFATRTEVRSTESGGPETRPRAGTIAEQRALEALRSSGKGKGYGKAGKQTFDV